MSNSGGPWGKEPTGDPENSGSRSLIWIVLVLAGVAGVWELSRLFPGSLATRGDNIQFLQATLLATLIASGVVYSRRFKLGESARHLATWGAIAAVLVALYIGYHRYRDAALDAGSELMPGYPVAVSANEMVLTENKDGDFEVIGQVNGVPVRFMVDTGASDIVLSPADAERAGIVPSKLQFTQRYETANGEGLGAGVTLDRLDVGEMRLREVPAAVNGTAMHSSLLGMAFLKRMKSFEMKGRKLTLRWR
jgi:aspartyl protease family protein